MIRSRFLFAVILLCGMAAGSSFAQPFFPMGYKNLSWKSLESKYATVLYHEPMEKMARRMAAVYDSVYLPVCKVYNYFPARQTLILKDTDDYSNGAAYFFDDKIEIYATALDFPLRGNHKWLEDVISHEFTHIVQIQSAMKWSKRIPAFYFQYFGYEDVRRPDYLYGYPNRLVSFPFLNIVVPAWLAEGTAQFNVPGLHYDYWDAHRDMILRARTLDSTLLTWSEMVSFNKTSLDGETVYNQGFNLVSYLSKTYGLDAVDRLNLSLKKKTVFSIGDALEDAFGKPGDVIYSEWVSALRSHYTTQIAPILPEIDEGRILSETGFSNWVDDFDPATGRLIIRSNQKADYFGQTVVLLMDTTGTETGRIEEIHANARIRFFNRNGKNYLLYSQTGTPNHLGSRYSDLWIWDFQKEEAIRLTRDARLFSPVWDGDSLIYAISNRNARKSVVCLSLSGWEPGEMLSITSDLTPENEETEFHTLDFQRESGLLAVDFTEIHGREIQLYSAGTKTWKKLLRTGRDNREPRWITPEKLLITSDETGIFNLYTLDLTTGKRTQITQVRGSVFQGVPLSGSQVAGSVFTGTGFKARIFTAAAKTLKPRVTYPFVNHPESEGIDEIPLNHANIQPVDGPVFAYRMRTQNPISFYPVLRLDGYIKSDGSYLDNIRQKNWDKLGHNLSRDLKIGTYAFSSDPLDWIQFSAGALINPFGDGKFTEWDRDVFLGLNLADGIFSSLLPVRWTIDYFNISRQAEDAVNFGVGEDSARANVIYNLNQVEAGAQIKTDPAGLLSLKYIYSSYSNKIATFFFKVNDEISKVSSSTDTYFTGHGALLNYSFEHLQPAKESSINPVGREGSLSIGAEANELLDSVFVENGALTFHYKKFSIFKYSIGYKEHIGLPFFNHTLSFWIRRAGVTGGKGEPFYYNYAGGFSGMRGYPFYSIGGFEMAHGQISYRFPIFRKLDKSFKMFYFDRLYGSVFADIGQAWNAKMPALSSFRRDAGFELRLESTSFYLMPIRIFFSGTYGFDRFDVALTKGFETPDGKNSVRYGQEWQYHFGMLFNFDLGLEKWNF